MLDCSITSRQRSKSRNQLCFQHYCPIHRLHSNQLSLQCTFSLLVQNLLQEYILHPLTLMPLQPDISLFKTQVLFPGHRTSGMMPCLHICVRRLAGDVNRGPCSYWYLPAFSALNSWFPFCSRSRCCGESFWDYVFCSLSHLVCGWLLQGQPSLWQLPDGAFFHYYYSFCMFIVRKNFSLSPIYLYKWELMNPSFIIHSYHVFWCLSCPRFGQ